jgi:hypothetical protein
MNFRRAELLRSNCAIIYVHVRDSTCECDRVDIQEYTVGHCVRDLPRVRRGHLKLCLTLHCVTTASEVTAIQHTRTRYAGVSGLLATLTNCHDDQCNGAPHEPVKVQENQPVLVQMN